jgi:serine/threonine-protein kinase
MPLQRAVDVLEQMGAALARAHDLGVVHRDLKSDNILLTTRGGRKDFVKILDFGLAALAHDPRLAPKGAVFGTPEYMSPEQARGESAGPQSDLYALGILLYEMQTGQLPFRSNDRDTLLEMQRSAPAPRPSALRKDCHPVAERITLRLLEKDPRRRYRDGHHLLEELKALQRSLPSQAWDKNEPGQTAQLPPPPPPPRSADVTEWASRAGLFSRMVSRAYPSGNADPEVTRSMQRAWELAAKANGLEGEIASHTRRLEALERRGRALRAEIGRKVEELAQEESRALRDVAALQEEEIAARLDLEKAEQLARELKARADACEKSGEGTRQIFEQAGASHAVLEVKGQHAKAREVKRAARESTAKDLRAQIEQLRSQLARYAEALEEDLAAGREKVAKRARDGLAYEEAFKETSNFIVRHLRGKPECRELLDEFVSSGGQNTTRSSDSRPENVKPSV